MSDYTRVTFGVRKVKWNVAYNFTFFYRGGYVFASDDNIIEVNDLSITERC